MSGIDFYVFGWTFPWVFFWFIKRTHPHWCSCEPGRSSSVRVYYWGKNPCHWWNLQISWTNWENPYWCSDCQRTGRCSEILYPYCLVSLIQRESKTIKQPGTVMYDLGSTNSWKKPSVVSQWCSSPPGFQCTADVQAESAGGTSGFGSD